MMLQGAEVQFSSLSLSLSLSPSLPLSFSFDLGERLKKQGIILASRCVCVCVCLVPSQLCKVLSVGTQQHLFKDNGALGGATKAAAL